MHGHIAQITFSLQSASTVFVLRGVFCYLTQTTLSKSFNPLSITQSICLKYSHSLNLALSVCLSVSLSPSPHQHHSLTLHLCLPYLYLTLPINTAHSPLLDVTIRSGQPWGNATSFTAPDGQQRYSRR
jgi:hypothetical protein